MKLQSIKQIALAVASTLALASSANAAINASAGDLILGVYQTDSAATGFGKLYEVDLGSITNFSSTVSNLDLSSKVSIADLSGLFGSSLSSASFSVYGAAGSSSSFTVGTPNPTTAFFGSVFITDANVPGTYSHNGLSAANSAIDGDRGTLAAQTPTANSSSAAILTLNAPNGITANNNFGIAASGTAVNVVAGFGSTANLYLLDPANNFSGTTRGQSYALGNFQFVNGTTFTFNAQSAVVPEPSTYVLMGFGALALFVIARRRAASNI